MAELALPKQKRQNPPRSSSGGTGMPNRSKTGLADIPKFSFEESSVRYRSEQPAPAQRQVIQKWDEYVPNGDTEPHLHIHAGGITYTGVGHRHKNLRAGTTDRLSAVAEVVCELKESDSANASRILQYLRNNFTLPETKVDRDASEIEDIKGMLTEMGINTAELEYTQDDGAFETAIKAVLPENIAHRGEKEEAAKPPKAEYIGNPFLRNAAYLKRAYNDYFDFLWNENERGKDEMELLDGSTGGKGRP